jgi:hypothetical protein
MECQVGNPSMSEQASYVSNYQRQQNNPYSNTYNPGWQNHPNFSWRNNQANSQPPPGFQQQDKEPSLKEILTQFISKSDSRMQNTEASIKALERQVGQLANQLSERTQGTLPSNTKPNPREHVKAVTLRNGRELVAEEKRAEIEDQQTETVAPEIPNRGVHGLIILKDCKRRNMMINLINSWIFLRNYKLIFLLQKC